MKYLLPVFTIACFSVTPVIAQEQQPQFYSGVSLSHVDMLAIPKQSEVRAKYAPSIFVGVGYEFDIDKNWQVEWNNNLNFSKVNIRSSEATTLENTALSNIGLWSHVKVKYNGLFDSASPFIRSGVGLVNVDYSVAGESKNTWDTATALQAGIEFELSEEASIEIALGKTDYNQF